MTKEYKEYLAHRDSPLTRADDFLAHYGVKGQKWGVRNYQYENGGYTPAGAERYWGGTGQGRRLGSGSSSIVSRQRQMPRTYAKSGPRLPTKSPYARSTRQRPVQNQNVRKQLTPEQIEARRAKTRKVLAIGAGVAVAAALGYAAYRGSTNLRDQARRDVYNNIDTDWRNVNTLGSKYWTSADRHRYTEATKAHADYIAKGITRRDAVANKFAEKTGIRINLPQNRERVLADRHEANTYANLLREFDQRGALNRQISEARKDLNRSKVLADRMNATRFKSQERYGAHLNEMNQQNIERYRKRLNSLLDQRRAAGF